MASFGIVLSFHSTRGERTDEPTMKLIGFGCHKLIKVLNRDRVQCGCVRACVRASFWFLCILAIPYQNGVALTFDPPAVVVVVVVLAVVFISLFSCCCCCR